MCCAWWRNSYSALRGATNVSVYTVISSVIVLAALCGFISHKVLRLPDAVGITIVALVLSLAVVIAGSVFPGIADWARAVVRNVDFPDLVFHGLLGLLLFAGSLHVNVGALARAGWIILLLATVGVVLSTAIVGAAFFFTTGILGTALPLMSCLLFGALISPTDPIATLGLLRKARVPHSLLTKITGEALFNDGTGVVVFLTLMSIASGTTSLDAWSVTGLLARQVAGGLGFGLVVGFAGFLLLRTVNSYVVETLLTLAMAMGGYAAAEALKVSAPIAAVVMGLVVGNYARQHAMSEETRGRLFSFWELTDELLNLLVFALLGIELLTLSSSVRTLAGPALLAIPVVLIARAVSVGLPILLLRPVQKFEAHTVKLLTWSGLRGALSVALALSLPEGHGRDLIVAATYVVALFSILVQATTVEPLARYWMRSGSDVPLADSCPGSPR
jgi:monovalent cation:H+ antiporter, CPA1 family